MGTLDSYIVSLHDVTDGNVSYQWHVDDDFFSAVELFIINLPLKPAYAA